MIVTMSKNTLELKLLQRNSRPNIGLKQLKIKSTVFILAISGIELNPWMVH